MSGQQTALAWVTAIQQALAASNLPRTSRLNGAELKGWTTHVGSTGFSVRMTDTGQLDWHIVVSGKPRLQYREYQTVDDGEVTDLHEPVNPEILYPDIQAVFERLGLVVHGVVHTSHQTLWDDDVYYNVLTDTPTELERGPGTGGFRGWGRTWSC